MTGAGPEHALDEHRLINAAQHGDRQAFGELVRRYRESVVRVVYRMCGEPWLAEEAAQEAFLKAWQNLNRYDDHYAFRSWVFRIALNAATDVLRREHPTDSLDTHEAEADGLMNKQHGPEQSFDERQRARAVRQAVMALPEASRAVVVLREYEELSYQEIAAALDIPIGTVMSRLNYARGQLRQTLSHFLEVA